MSDDEFDAPWLDEWEAWLESLPDGDAAAVRAAVDRMLDAGFSARGACSAARDAVTIAERMRAAGLDGSGRPRGLRARMVAARARRQARRSLKIAERKGLR